MICVSIGRGRHRHLLAEHRHLVELGAPLVELRLDYIQGKVNLKRLLTDRPGPVVATCRRAADGGRWSGTEEDRLLLLRTAIVEGVDYVDLEEDVASKVRRYGATRRIVSFHDFRKTPDDLLAIHARLAALDADIVKLATLANHASDNLRMLELVRRANCPTVGFCMGEIGTPSRVLCGRFGSPFTYATFDAERTLAPGQLSFQQMRQLYRYDDLNAETEVFGVIGDPIAHSHSPLVHNAAFGHLGMNRVYVPWRIPRSEVLEFLDWAPRLGVRGLSVTIPHKETVLPGLARVDGAVRNVGAANTIVYDGDKRVGYNTDYRAAIDSLEEALLGEEGARGDNSPLAGRTVLLLGAGGVAKAIAHGAHRRQARVLITNRTPERALHLAQAVGCQTVEWNARHGVKFDVLVNCTPVGMHPHVDSAPFEKEYLRARVVVFDTVYNPESTLLIKDARARGCPTVTGVDMFIRQAALQFKLFTQCDAPQGVMRDALKRALGPAKLGD